VRLALPLALLVGMAPLAPGRLQAQESAPLPPIRPFDMDMPVSRPRISTPSPSQPLSADQPAADGAAQLAPLPPTRPATLPKRAAGTDEDPAISIPEQPAIAAPVFNFPNLFAPSPATPNAAAPNVAPPTTTPHATPTDREWPTLTPAQRDNAETAPVDDTPTGPGITTDPGTSTACLPARLKSVLEKVAAKYGSVRVTSTYRPAWRARRGSYHRRCEAVDFRVPGHRPGEVLALVRTYPETGGRKVYWNGLIHVDTGPERSW
jgi:hypothetical protein